MSCPSFCCKSEVLLNSSSWSRMIRRKSWQFHFKGKFLQFKCALQDFKGKVVLKLMYVPYSIHGTHYAEVLTMLVKCICPILMLPNNLKYCFCLFVISVVLRVLDFNLILGPKHVMDLAFAAKTLYNSDKQFYLPWGLIAYSKCQEQNEWKQCQTIINFPKHRNKKVGFITKETVEIRSLKLGSLVWGKRGWNFVSISSQE